MGAGYSGGVIDTESEKDLPTYNHPGQPNSRYNYYKNGLLKKSVWTNSNGVPIKSRHFTNHGSPKAHPVVPHDHDWGWRDGKWTEFSEWYEGDEE